MLTSKKVFFAALFVSINGFAQSEKFYPIIDERYAITNSSLAMYSHELQIKEKGKKLDFKKLDRVKIQKDMNEAFRKALATKFTKAEIEYLEKLNSHELLGRFDHFMRAFVAEHGTKAAKQSIEGK